MLQHCESLVKFLQDSNNSVVLLHILLGPAQCYLCVESPGGKQSKIITKLILIP